MNSLDVKTSYELAGALLFAPENQERDGEVEETSQKDKGGWGGDQMGERKGEGDTEGGAGGGGGEKSSCPQSPGFPGARLLSRPPTLCPFLSLMCHI